MPKLTLSADKDVIELAKRLAEERGTSVSAMFRQFVEASARLSEDQSDVMRRQPIGPITRSVRGLGKVSPEKSDRELYEEAILEKARR